MEGAPDTRQRSWCESATAAEGRWRGGGDEARGEAGMKRGQQMTHLRDPQPTPPLHLALTGAAGRTGCGRDGGDRAPRLRLPTRHRRPLRHTHRVAQRRRCYSRSCRRPGAAATAAGAGQGVLLPAKRRVPVRAGWVDWVYGGMGRMACVRLVRLDGQDGMGRSKWAG